MFWHVFDVGIRVLALVFAVWFVIAYSRVNWRKYLEGRHIMHFTWMVIAFLSLTLVYIAFGPSQWYSWVARILFTWLAYLLYERGRLQRHAQREHNSVSAPPEDNTTTAGTELLEEGNYGNH